jgi:hypothetical protein
MKIDIIHLNTLIIKNKCIMHRFIVKIEYISLSQYIINYITNHNEYNKFVFTKGDKTTKRVISNMLIIF